MSMISIIIPCYNGWKYMGRCMAALENQTVAPKEVIIVDDCSTDDSFEQLNTYSKNTKLPIRILRNKQNSGPGASRKKAIDAASGEYIAFCDCDDWYELDFIETIEGTISQKASTDVVIFDYNKTYGYSKEPARTTEKLNTDDKREILANAKMSLCCFVVKAKIMNAVICPSLYHGEDGAITPQIIAKSTQISIIKRPLYNYLYRFDSASLKPTPEAYVELIEAFKVVQAVIKSEFYPECEYIGVKYVCYGAVLNALKAGINSKRIRESLDNFEKDYPNWQKNKYLLNLGEAKNVFLCFIRKRLFVSARIMASLHDFFIRTKRR